MDVCCDSKVELTYGIQRIHSFFGTFLCCSFWWFLDGKDILNVLAELNNMLKTAGQKLHFNIEQATHAWK